MLKVIENNEHLFFLQIGQELIPGGIISVKGNIKYIRQSGDKGVSRANWVDGGQGDEPNAVGKNVELGFGCLDGQAGFAHSPGAKNGR